MSFLRSEPPVIIRTKDTEQVQIAIAPLVPPAAGNWSKLGGDHEKNLTRPVSVATDANSGEEQPHATMVVAPEACAKQVLQPWRKFCQFAVPPESEVMVQSTTATVHYTRVRFGMHYRAHGQYKLFGDVPCREEFENAIIAAGGKKEKFAVLSGHFNNADDFSMRLRVHGSESMPRICKRRQERVHSKYKLPFVRSYSDLDGYLVGAETPHSEEWPATDESAMEKAKALATLFKVSRDSIGKVTQEAVPQVNRFTKMELIDVVRYTLPGVEKPRKDGVTPEDVSSAELVFEFEEGKNPLHFNQEDQYTTIKLDAEEDSSKTDAEKVEGGQQEGPKEKKLAWKSIHALLQLSSCEETAKGKPSNSASNNAAKLETFFKILNFSGYCPPSIAELGQDGATAAKNDGATSDGMLRSSTVLKPENLVWDDLKLYSARGTELLGRKFNGLQTIYVGGAAPKYDHTKLFTAEQENELKANLIRALKQNNAQPGKVHLSWQLGKGVLVADGDPHASFGARTTGKGGLYNFYRSKTEDAFVKRNGIVVNLVVNGHKLKFVEEGEATHQESDHIGRMSRCVVFRPNTKADLNIELSHKDPSISSVFPDEKDRDAIQKVAQDMIYQLRRCVRRDDMEAASNLQLPTSMRDAAGELLNFDVHYDWEKELVFTWPKSGWSYVIRHRGRFAFQELRYETPGAIEVADDRFCKKQHQHINDMMLRCFNKEGSREGNDQWNVDSVVDLTKGALQFLDTVDPARPSATLLTASVEVDEPDSSSPDATAEKTMEVEDSTPKQQLAPVEQKEKVQAVQEASKIVEVPPTQLEGKSENPLADGAQVEMVKEHIGKADHRHRHNPVLPSRAAGGGPQFDLDAFIRVHLSPDRTNSDELAKKIQWHLQSKYNIESVAELYNAAGTGKGTTVVSDPFLGCLFPSSQGHHGADTAIRYHTTQLLAVGTLDTPAVVISSGEKLFSVPWSQSSTTLLLPFKDVNELEAKILPELPSRDDVHVDVANSLVAVPNTLSKQPGVGILQSGRSQLAGFFSSALPPSVLFTVDGTAVPVVPTPLHTGPGKSNKLGFSPSASAVNLPEFAPLFFRGLWAGFCRGKARIVSSPRLQFAKK